MLTRSEEFGSWRPAASPEVGDARGQNGAPLLDLLCQVGNGYAMVYVRGELDLSSAEQLCEYVRHILDGPNRVVILDLSSMTFCDGRGLGALVRIANHADEMGSRIVLAEPTRVVTKIMRITGLNSRFTTVYSTGDHSDGSILRKAIA